MKEILNRLRTAFLAILVVISVALGAVRLMTIQIVNGDNYFKNSEYTSVYTQSIKASRGQIVDYRGEPIVANKVGYNIIIDASRFPEEKLESNRILLETMQILKENKLKWTESIPITADMPYEFKDKADENDIAKAKKLAGVNVYATAQNCIDQLISDYEIDKCGFTLKEQREVAGLRYEMLLRDFSMSNTFTLCEDVPLDVVIKIKELGIRLKGVNIVEDAVREIAVGDVIPHEIGAVGPVYKEDYEELKEKGYAMNDTVGRGGIEGAMEDKLRGKDGEKTITVTDGQIISANVTREPKGGNTVKLTVDSEYQRDVQSILENFTSYLRTMPEYYNVRCGAIVVLDVKDNAVLALATAPTYDLFEYINDYDKVANGDDSPLLNRATRGLYRPGSTFKTITATAGLNEGIINGESTYHCEQKYEFYDIEVGCTGWHNDIAVPEALKVSCNIFFYELGRHLGIDLLSKYAGLYGFGQHTGLETGDQSGQFADPDTFNELGIDWTVGHVLQASIGQSETACTPLQMAVQASTIANHGVRYQPHLVDSLYDYAMTEQLEAYKPEIAAQIDLNNDYVYDYITKGMILASTNGFPSQYSLSDLGFDVAIKTGTPQNWRDGLEITDSAFVGFAPAHDPKIAFAGMIEGGEFSKYMIRSIIQAYYKEYPESGSCYGSNGRINFLPEREKPKKPTEDEDADAEATETTEADTTEPSENE